MPYHDERAGLDAIRAIADSNLLEDFRNKMVARHTGEPLPLPRFERCPAGTPRTHILAIDGSNVHAPIPGALPCTEAGIVSLGMVVIDIEKLTSLECLPDSGASNPRDLRATEDPTCLGLLLPGRNAARKDGTDPRTWFREIFDDELATASFGGETFAETLDSLLADTRTIKCPNPSCKQPGTDVPAAGRTGRCTACHEPIYLADGLRIHTQFEENSSAVQCHNRVRDALEILALMNTLRYLAGSREGRRAIAKTAFVIDGPLAAFGTIAVLARAVQKQLWEIQRAVQEHDPASNVLVMSGVKSGPFVEHAEELDRDPAPDRQIPNNHVWLPDNDYIRDNIIAGRMEEGSKPWGELTYFGRPVVFKTDSGRRLVLNLAQPEADPPLTEAAPPSALPDALATAGPLGVGDHQFLALRRAHSRAAIPLRLGTDLIHALAP